MTTFKRSKPPARRKVVYVVDGSRTPQLKARGQPGPFRASDLAVMATRPLFNRLPLEVNDLDEVILGCVMPGPDEANIARIVALRLGCDEHIPAWTVQRNCASGMQAIDAAFKNIQGGHADIILAGGTEAMSYAPLLYPPGMSGFLNQVMTAKKTMDKVKALSSFKWHYLKPVIGLLRGLTDPVVGLNMGQTAEQIAWRFGISRQAMDHYAARSHQRLASAIDAGYLDEITPLFSTEGQVYSWDDGLRRDVSAQSLAKLRPYFDKKYGSVTAGNSSQITDGACTLLLASDRAVRHFKLPVLGKIVDSQWSGLDPAEMGLGPVHAMTPIMQRQQLHLNDIDCFEINEAFAAQVLACQQAWDDGDYCRHQLGLENAMGMIPDDRLNIDGGGISLGHPVGASGARIVLHLLTILKRQQTNRGIASLCIGGGQGGAMLLENPHSAANGESPNKRSTQ